MNYWSQSEKQFLFLKPKPKHKPNEKNNKNKTRKKVRGIVIEWESLLRKYYIIQR